MKARPLAEWTEEAGEVLWWRFPVCEPPYVGSPLCDDWPGCHTHWTPLEVPAAPGENPVAALLRRHAIRVWWASSYEHLRCMECGAMWQPETPHVTRREEWHEPDCAVAAALKDLEG